MHSGSNDNIGFLLSRQGLGDRSYGPFAFLSHVHILACATTLADLRFRESKFMATTEHQLMFISMPQSFAIEYLVAFTSANTSTPTFN